MVHLTDMVRRHFHLVGVKILWVLDRIRPARNFNVHSVAIDSQS